MEKIDISKAEQWGKTTNHGAAAPRHIDLYCPHEGCGKPNFSIPIEWKVFGNAAHAEITCVSCKNRINYYMVHPPRAQSAIEESQTAIYRHT